MSKFAVNTYSAEDVSLIISGWQVKGWENISLMKRVDSFITVPGIRGKHTRVPTNDSSSTLVLPILQTERSNDIFSQIHALDILLVSIKLYNYALSDSFVRTVGVACCSSNTR